MPCGGGEWGSGEEAARSRASSMKMMAGAAAAAAAKRPLSFASDSPLIPDTICEEATVKGSEPWGAMNQLLPLG